MVWSTPRDAQIAYSWHWHIRDPYIDAGELLILVTGGIVVTPEDRQTGSIQVEGEMYNQETLAENVFIITPKVFHYYINHSCDANIVDLSRRANSTQYVASRAISAHDEITAD